MHIDKDIDKNINYLDTRFKEFGDLVKRKFPVGENREHNLYISYIDVMTDRAFIDELMDILMIDIRQVKPTGDELKENIFDALKNGGLATADFFEETDFEKVIDEILAGNTLLLIDGFDKAIILSTKGFPRRSVSTADTEVVVQGSKEAFTETFRVNTVLIRRRIRDTNLKLKQMRIGKRSKTDVAIMYMEDIARPEILEEVQKRLNMIDIDGILDSGYIEQFIEDDYKSPFPQMQMTERPDKVAAALLEGRIAIVVDNTPFVIIVPTILASFYQSSEDYYQRWEIMSFIRIIRYIAGVIAVCLPGLYIAIAVYHPAMIPMELILKMAEARQTVPIPAVVEIVLMELAFETLREAGIRLPTAIGSTLGIVGGIIIGQAAVEAGLVSPIVVIVISLTAICSFAIPNIALVAGYRLTKYFIILLSSLLGFFGFWLAILVCLIHLVTLKSFGIPYLYPFVSVKQYGLNDIKDTIIKLPIFMLRKRPIFSKDSQKIRLSLNKNKKEDIN
ncbi:spore germination protein [uncultured Tyzzerella sp.]|uniref:spore germination protein n=1 Tax=uncultured Tyzzerella sp. TaxID=2321398 RepID=UPI002943AA7C|nr:spore germination protein [uncultured Tyzzerella sp.]